MSAQPHSFRSLNERIEQIIDELDKTNDPILIQELKVERSALEELADVLWFRFNDRRQLIRLLRAINQFPDEVPDEYRNYLKRLVTILGFADNVILTLIEDQTYRDRIIMRLTNMIDFFLQNELDPKTRTNELEIMQADRYIDEGLEYKLTRDLPDLELIEELKTLPEGVFEVLQQRLVFRLSDTVEDFVKILNTPEERAAVGARLGDYGMVHDAMDQGANDWGRILVELDLSEKARLDDELVSTLYLLNAQDRTILIEEIISIIETDQELPGARYRVSRETDLMGTERTRILERQSNGSWKKILTLDSI